MRHRKWARQHKFHSRLRLRERTLMGVLRPTVNDGGSVHRSSVSHHCPRLVIIHLPYSVLVLARRGRGREGETALSHLPYPVLPALFLSRIRNVPAFNPFDLSKISLPFLLQPKCSQSIAACVEAVVARAPTVLGAKMVRSMVRATPSSCTESMCAAPPIFFHIPG